jgi:hypothetical protein
MTALREITELLSGLPGSGKNLSQVADELLTLAARGGGVALSRSGGPDGLAGLNPRLFRPLLAVLAKAAANESGEEFDPYHGRYTLTRSGEQGGQVRLDIAIENTSAVQSLRVTATDPAEPRSGLPLPTSATDHRAPIA